MCSVQEKSSGRSAHYKLTSTVMLWLQTTKSGSGTMNLGGSLTRQVRCSATRVTDDVFWELRPVRNCSNLIADRKGWNGWRVLAPHRQYWPARRGQLSSKHMFLFILTVRSAEITWTVFCVCLVFAWVLSSTCQLSEKRAIDKWRHESKELRISSFCFQDMENKIRSTLNEIYFGKTKDIVNGLRWDRTCWSDRWPVSAGSSRWDLCGRYSFSLCDLLPLSRSLWLVSKPSVTSPPLCAPDQLNLCLITKSTDSSRRSCHKSSPSVRSSLTRFRGTFLHGGTTCGWSEGTSQPV